MPDSDGVDWQQLAERVSARHRGRDSLIRGVAVVGDYARNQVWEGSLLQIVLFRHRSEALIDEGGVVEENGVSVAIDSITSGSLVELEELLHLEPLAGNLADMHTLRMADQTLRDVLATFRDRYHSADGRQLRARRALQRARVALDDYESGRRPIDAIEALRSGIFPAASALVGEPVDHLRLPRRVRAAARLIRLPSLWAEIADALALESEELEARWAAIDALHSLARSHLDARMPEVGAALIPRLERAIIPARRGSAALSRQSDGIGAAWSALSAAAELDGVVEAASPGWRERDDYRHRSEAVFGRPDAKSLRSICVQLQSRLA
ncbi:MAG: hypothetical protein F4Y04_07885 [Chloroflexi bacterium]|nr:hypothetical protein [Chloroflexota bacterium]